MRSGLFKAVVLIALLSGSPAFAKTYEMSEIGNGFAITGSIVTDGQFGVLSQADILSWDLNIITSGGIGGISHLTGPSSVVPIERVDLTGSGLTADNFGLFFNFGGNFSIFRFEQIGQNNSLIGLIEFETLPIIQLDILTTDIFGAPISGVVIPPAATLQFAVDPTAFDAVATPLPAALPLFATGLGALGLLGWRRKRKAAALAA